MTVQIRPLRPSDYRPVISVVDSWWNGRHMADMLPRLFFEHFTDTSFAAERDGELAGFLVGLLSQSRPGEAYIHFVGVHPAERGRGLGRQLYQQFFAAAQARGAGLVRAVTAPVNQGSVRFHQQLGFGVEPGDQEVDGVPVATGYDGDGQDRVRFTKHLNGERAPLQLPLHADDLAGYGGDRAVGQGRLPAPVDGDPGSPAPGPGYGGSTAHHDRSSSVLIDNDIDIRHRDT